MVERTIIITGASDGIGAAAARALSAEGNRIVVVGRSGQKTKAVATEIGADYFVADFAELDQVRGLALALRSEYPRIDVLANNAGALMGSRELTVDGYEKTFQVNHLAPFLLTRLLTGVLVDSGARVLNTSSHGNRFLGYLDLDDLDHQRRYSPGRAYGTAKLANILFTRELQRRYFDAGLTTAAFHPGVVATNFSAHSNSPMRLGYGKLVRKLLRTPEEGADTLIWLATAPTSQWASGEYYANRQIAAANKQAYDLALARGLWERSDVLVGAWLGEWGN